MEHIVDIFEPDVSFVVEETKDEVDGKHVLGKVKGQFFVPDGYSRNRRFYPKSLWEKTIKKVKEKLQNRTMFGTIGHEQELNDKALLEGKVSHVVTNLYIQGDRGIGEALILNTPAGQVLNTLLRAGSKLFVSSRAEGKYSSKTEDGVPVVDEDSYNLRGFDFVIDPGFLQAQPDLIESINKIIQKEDKKEDNMDPILQSKIEENVKLKEDLNKALGELEKIQKEKKEVTEQLTKYQELGKFDEVKEELDKYKKLGTPEEIEKAMTEAEELIKEYEELGTPEEIKEAIDKAEEVFSKYKELGTPEEIEEAIDKSKEILDTYKELGTPDEIKQVFDKFEALVKETVDQIKAKKVEELADELGVSKDVVAKAFDKFESEEEVKDFIKDMIEQLGVKQKFEKKEEKIGEGKEHNRNSPLEESMGSRLLKYFV